MADLHQRRSWQSLSEDEQYTLFDLTLDDETDPHTLNESAVNLLSRSSVQAPNGDWDFPTPNPNWSEGPPSDWRRQASEVYPGARRPFMYESTNSNPFAGQTTLHIFESDPMLDPPSTPSMEPTNDPLSSEWELPSIAYEKNERSFRELLEITAVARVDPPEPASTPYIPPTDDPMLVAAMSNADFIPDEPTDALIIVMTPSEQRFTIHNVSLEKIEEACPLLAAGFEESRGASKCIIDVKSRLLAVSFLRFLYTGSYLIQDQQQAGREVVLPSLLFHVQMYQLARTFDVAALTQQAKINIMRVTEYSCSTPSPAQDLYGAVEFIYEKLSGEAELKATLQHYVVSCFDYHKLKEVPEFCALIRDLPEFGIGLCRMNVEHDFRDKGAADIIKLPMPAKPNDSVLNCVYEVWGPEVFTARTGYETSTQMCDETDSSIASIRRTFTLVRRPKAPGKAPMTDDSESESSMSEAEDFALVRRPKQSAAAPAVSAGHSSALSLGEPGPLLGLDGADDAAAADDEDSDDESVQSDFTIVG